MDDDLADRLAALAVETQKSSDERLARVNAIVEKMTQQTAIINDLALRVVKNYEECRKAEEDKYKLMMEFLEEMRTTYDKHLTSIEKDRDRAAEALLAQQQISARLVEKVLSGASISLHDIGNNKTR